MKKLIFLFAVIATSCTKPCYQCTLKSVDLQTNETNLILTFEVCDTQEVNAIIGDEIIDGIVYVTRCE